MRLAKIPNVVGIKDSSRDFTRLMDFLQAAPEGFDVINGNDSYLFPALCAGVKAGVCHYKRLPRATCCDVSVFWQRRLSECSIALDENSCNRESDQQSPYRVLISSFEDSRIEEWYCKVST